ncbi:DNA-binding protein [Variovorax sp. RTB1]|uniref:DNA-binding protein n=1 Tax=Variovorax sp. RTB1 TaxID=3048631 RepID=UPI002B234AE1|nr:DNA-binding protein [Variovorax sp. RTB1]MEB0114250.1 DNA-binding protein [Variovorax sp. RTB1]
MEFTKARRGTQEHEVWAAADALMQEGLRPTIDRIRQKLGKGSPNTVSPMMESWFRSLGSRLAGGVSGTANLAAGNEADGVPVSVRNATRLLWETARKEAEQVQEVALEKARNELKAREDELEGKRLELTQREDAFAQTRASLDHALASSQQAREALEHQVTALASEGLRQREAAAKEMARLNSLLVDAQAVSERLRDEHSAALAIRDRDIRDAVDRHMAQERRMLEDVDRSRQLTKQSETALARERQQRFQSEEAAAAALETGRRMLRETQQAAQQLERELRDQHAAQSTSLVQAQSQEIALQQRLDDLHEALREEKAAHQHTRGLLADMLAATKKLGDAKRPRAKPRAKSETDS